MEVLSSVVLEEDQKGLNQEVEVRDLVVGFVENFLGVVPHCFKNALLQLLFIAGGIHDQVFEVVRHEDILLGAVLVGQLFLNEQPDVLQKGLLLFLLGLDLVRFLALVFVLLQVNVLHIAFLDLLSLHWLFFPFFYLSQILSDYSLLLGLDEFLEGKLTPELLHLLEVRLDLILNALLSLGFIHSVIQLLVFGQEVRSSLVEQRQTGDLLLPPLNFLVFKVLVELDEEMLGLLVFHEDNLPDFVLLQLELLFREQLLHFGPVVELPLQVQVVVEVVSVDPWNVSLQDFHHHYSVGYVSPEVGHLVAQAQFVEPFQNFPRTFKGFKFHYN